MADHDVWFEEPEQVLNQADILVGIDVYTYVTRDGMKRPAFSMQAANVIVLTQSCDIPKPAQSTILCAQIDSYDDVIAHRGNGQDGRKWRQRLVADGAVSDLLLPPCPRVGLGWSLVNFRGLFVLPKTELEGPRLMARRRVALASPYREYLAQAYARFVMRVGLPDTLHDFVDHTPPPRS